MDRKDAHPGGALRGVSRQSAPPPPPAPQPPAPLPQRRIHRGARPRHRAQGAHPTPSPPSVSAAAHSGGRKGSIPSAGNGHTPVPGGDPASTPLHDEATALMHSRFQSPPWELGMAPSSLSRCRTHFYAHRAISLSMDRCVRWVGRVLWGAAAPPGVRRWTRPATPSGDTPLPSLCRRPAPPPRAAPLYSYASTSRSSADLPLFALRRTSWSTGDCKCRSVNSFTGTATHRGVLGVFTLPPHKTTVEPI